MSMIGNFRRLPNADLERLVAEPALIHAYLYEDDVAGFGPFADIDVDKAWHGIQFLLTGSAWGGAFPASFIVTGGREIGDVDVGYGPARGFSAVEVQEIAAALGALDASEFERRFDPRAMTAAEIYPTIWDREGERGEHIQYLAEYFGALQSFVADAAEAGEALLVYMN